MDCSEEDWEFGMRLNAFSPFICIKYALPHMLKSVRTPATRLAAAARACVSERRLLLRLRVLASTTNASVHELIHNQAAWVRPGGRLNHHDLLRPRLPPPSWPAKRPLPDVQGRAREPDVQHRGGELSSRPRRNRLFSLAGLRWSRRSVVCSTGVCRAGGAGELRLAGPDLGADCVWVLP